MRAAARRLRADDTLARMQSDFAAFAAVMCKDGQRVFEKRQNALLRLINPDA
ncbi:MAG TPA: hypothetical protein VHG89_04885 [Verrucomicrobiae bacterium]|nr:hypothetical protein [Verrucomicrobiae bacterium]